MIRPWNWREAQEVGMRAERDLEIVAVVGRQTPGVKDDGVEARPLLGGGNKRRNSRPVDRAQMIPEQALPVHGRSPASSAVKIFCQISPNAPLLITRTTSPGSICAA